MQTAMEILLKSRMIEWALGGPQEIVSEGLSFRNALHFSDGSSPPVWLLVNTASLDVSGSSADFCFESSLLPISEN